MVFILFVLVLSVGVADARREEESDQGSLQTISVDASGSSRAEGLETLRFQVSAFQKAAASPMFEPSDSFKLKGFTAFESLNARYTKDSTKMVKEQPTYWSQRNFMYKCKDGYWRIVHQSYYFNNKIEGGDKCLAYAYPGGLSWYEYDGGWQTREVIVSLPCGSHQTQEACEGSCEETNCCSWNQRKNTCAAKWGVYDTVQMEDVSQGELGTCYFLAALAVIAKHSPYVLEGMFDKDRLSNEVSVPGVHSSSGSNRFPVYTVTYLLDGKPTRVSVDGAVPVSGGGPMAMSVGYSATHEFWPVIVEKAWAKIFGSYKAVEAGFAQEALKAITGAPAKILWHSTRSGYDAEELWQGLLEGIDNSNAYPMITASDAAGERQGTAAGHAYGVIGVNECNYKKDDLKPDPPDTVSLAEDGDCFRTVTLYNPWGSDRYNGTVPNEDKTDGLFEMTLKEFGDAFHYTAIAKVRKGYRATSFSVPLAEGSDQEHTISFTMLNDLPFEVMVAWPNSRLFNKKDGCDPVEPDVNVTVKNTVSGEQTTNVEDWRRDVLHMSNDLVSMKGGSGGYTASIHVNFKTDHGSLLPELRFVVYHAEEGNAADASSLIMEHVASTVRDVVTANSTRSGSLLEGGTLKRMSNACLELYNRLETLDNYGEIMQNGGVDPMFKRDKTSVAQAGESCGDSAQGIEEDCSKYDRWMTFEEMMINESPGGFDMLTKDDSTEVEEVDVKSEEEE